MVKRKYTKKDWEEFRKEILDLVILYNHVNEYSQFTKDQIEIIQSFYFLSRKQAIGSFYIKLGLIIDKSNGNTCLFNFLDHDRYESLRMLYKEKVKIIRDNLFAHHNLKKAKQVDQITNEEIDFLFNEIIKSAEIIDKKFNDPFHYSFVSNSDGIKSLIPIINESFELGKLKNELIENDFKGRVELGIQDGKIRLLK
ncbi:MAG: hypothetical protein WEA99_10695 [Brumimicrobium sp.]